MFFSFSYVLYIPHIPKLLYLQLSYISQDVLKYPLIKNGEQFSLNEIYSIPLFSFIHYSMYSPQYSHYQQYSPHYQFVIRPEQPRPHIFTLHYNLYNLHHKSMYNQVLFLPHKDQNNPLQSLPNKYYMNHLDYINDKVPHINQYNPLLLHYSDILQFLSQMGLKQNFVINPRLDLQLEMFVLFRQRLCEPLSVLSH